MAAAIVYDGAGDRGTLFGGKKFWIAQRVPLRPTWIELIRVNGGEIVLIEKFADIMIADHLRKDAPTGSYSWTWIEKSVKHGKLEDLESHRAGPDVETVRPVGSSKPTRSTRTPFTAADDRTLALWVMNAGRQGLPIKGNDIYEQLQQMNPRHTSQSWRDRWVKHGQYQTRPDLTQSDIASGPINKRPTASRTRVSSSRNSNMEHATSTPRPVTRPANVQESSQLEAPSVMLATGNFFTKEDGELLMYLYDDIMNIDETQLFDAWMAFSIANPQHSAKEWYKFWIEDIKPLRAPAIKGPKIPAKSVSPTPSPQRQETPRAPIKMESEEELTFYTTTVKELAMSSTGKEQVMPVTRNEQTTSHESPIRDQIDEAYFEHSLKEFLEAQNVEIDFQPVVEGRKFRLYDLWEIVNKAEFDLFEEVENTTKWHQLASKLGFDKARHSKAALALREICDSTLAEYEEARLEYRKLLEGVLEKGDKLREEQAIDLERMRAVDQRENAVPQVLYQESEDDLEIPSSPPPRIGLPPLKRGIPARQAQGHRGTNQQPIMTPNKRQRVDKGKERLLEIPSTPEDFLTFEGQVTPKSPFTGQGLAKIMEQETELGIDEDEDDAMFLRPAQLSLVSDSDLQPTRKDQIEPETQDFYFTQQAKEGNNDSLSQQIPKDISDTKESIAVETGPLNADSPTHSQTDSQHEEMELSGFIDHHIALGYPEEVALKALLATTLETRDAAMVMEALMKGNDLPENMVGVWTNSDDRALTSMDNGEDYVKVLVKHGRAQCLKRQQFLNENALEG